MKHRQKTARTKKVKMGRRRFAAGVAIFALLMGLLYGINPSAYAADPMEETGDLEKQTDAQEIEEDTEITIGSVKEEATVFDKSEDASGKEQTDSEESDTFAAEEIQLDEFDFEEAKTAAEDGVYTSLLDENTVLYITVSEQCISDLLVAANADKEPSEGALTQSEWDVLLNEAKTALLGAQVTEVIINEHTLKPSDDMVIDFPEEEKETVLCAWEQLMEAISTGLQNEKLSESDEAYYQSLVQELKRAKAKNEWTETVDADVSEPDANCNTTKRVNGPRKVSGAQIAADGTYTATVTVTKTKDSGKTKRYYGTLYVTVADGKISNLSIYASDKQTRFTELVNSVYSNYVGQPATVNAGVDAVTSASLGGSGSSGSSSKYSSDLVQAIARALESAPARSGSSDSAETSAADGVYTGTGKMSTNDHYITLEVTVSDGKISKLTIKDADGSWDSLLSQVASAYVGNAANTDTVDAVTTATAQGYRQCIADAIIDALGGTPTGGGSGDSGGEEPKPDENGVYTLKVGETLTLSTDDPSYSYYSWTVSDASKVSIESGKDTNTATIQAKAVTSSPVTVTCEYGIEGFSFMNQKKTFKIKVIPADSGSEEVDISEDTVYESGTTEMVTGKTFTGRVIIRNDAQITFENCTFQKGIFCDDSSAIAIIHNGTFTNADGSVKLALTSNEFGTVYTNTELTKESNIRALVPNKTSGEELKNISLVTKPNWANGQHNNETVKQGQYEYQSYTLTGTTPEESGREVFALNLVYGNRALDTTVPMILTLRQPVVTFQVNGGTEVDPLPAETGKAIAQPTTSKDGFELEDWYRDEELTTKWDFSNDVVTEDITLYAKWTEKTSVEEPPDTGIAEKNRPLLVAGVLALLGIGETVVSRWRKRTR